MSDAPPPLSEAAQAVADSKIPPGDEYEEIREQVRQKKYTRSAQEFCDGLLVNSQANKIFCADDYYDDRIDTCRLPTLPE